MIPVSTVNFASLANAAAPSAGGQVGTTGYIDVAGGQASISGGLLVVAASSGSSFVTDWIVRPFSEAAVNQQISTIVKAGGQTPLVLLRVNAARTACYTCWCDTSGYINIGIIQGGALSEVESAQKFTYSASTDFILTASAIASGTSTVITASVATLSAPNTPLGTVAYTDSTAAIQSAGTYGLSNAGGALSIEQVQTFSSVPTTNVVYIGDSRTYGVNGTGAGTAAATRLATVAAGLPVVVNNQGVSGQTLVGMISNLASFNALWDPTKINVAVVQGGTNDWNEGYTVAQVNALTLTLLDGLLSAHPWLIVWSPELPAAYPGYPANFDSLAAAHASWLRSNWRSVGISALSDPGLDTRLGYAGCEYNPAYFSATDHTHLTDLGYSIWGGYDLAAIQTTLASGSPASRIINNGSGIFAG